MKTDEPFINENKHYFEWCAFLYEPEDFFNTKEVTRFNGHGRKLMKRRLKPHKPQIDKGIVVDFY